MSIDINREIENSDDFRNERMPVLHEFSQSLGFENAHEILINPMKFIEPISCWLSEQEI